MFVRLRCRSSSALLALMLAMPAGAWAQGIASPYRPAEPKPALTGTVKSFNDAKGYGFLTPDDGTGDVYVHHSKIDVEGFKTLKKGQRVRFVVSFGRNGREASEVEVIPDKPEEPPQK